MNAKEKKVVERIGVHAFRPFTHSHFGGWECVRCGYPKDHPVHQVSPQHSQEPRKP